MEGFSDFESAGEEDAFQEPIVPYSLDPIGSGSSSSEDDALREDPPTQQSQHPYTHRLDRKDW
jgi:hypothetical protein